MPATAIADAAERLGQMNVWGRKFCKVTLKKDVFALLLRNFAHKKLWIYIPITLGYTCLIDHLCKCTLVCGSHLALHF